MKVAMSGDGDLLLLAEILDGLNFDLQQFQQMCIMAGCDYLKNVKGIGIQKSFRIVSSKHDIMELLSLRASDAYKEKFCKVEAIFKHQMVFDIETCTTVPLQKYHIELSMDVQHLCGEYPYI